MNNYQKIVTWTDSKSAAAPWSSVHENSAPRLTTAPSSREIKTNHAVPMPPVSSQSGSEASSLSSSHSSSASINVTDQVKQYSNVNRNLKYGAQEKFPFWCKCSIFLILTFLEIEKSFTKTFLILRILKQFAIRCKQMKVSLFNVLML